MAAATSAWFSARSDAVADPNQVRKHLRGHAIQYNKHIEKSYKYEKPVDQQHARKDAGQFLDHVEKLCGDLQISPPRPCLDCELIHKVPGIKRSQPPEVISKCAGKRRPS
jgi:hypothetical protein